MGGTQTLSSLELVEPIFELAKSGTRFLIIPGNHERSEFSFDQASVGPNDFVFRSGRQDTVSRATTPLDFDYIAAGHIHRYQVLDHPLKPGIVYPGSTQRISFAEMYEYKWVMR